MKAILFLKLGEGVFLEVCQYLVSQQQNKKKKKKNTLHYEELSKKRYYLMKFQTYKVSLVWNRKHQKK